MAKHRGALRALGPSGWGFSAPPSRAAAVVAAVPPAPCLLAFQESCPHPGSHFLFFFPCLLFPVAFPFFPASQGNEKKVRKPRTQGNFLLLLLLFQDREVTPPTPSPYVSCRFSSFLPPLSSWASLVAVLNPPPSVQRPSGYRAGGRSWPLAASQVLLLSPLPCPSMCSELPRASGSPLLKLA